MLPIPSGSQVIIPDVLFIYLNFLANVPGSGLKKSSTPVIIPVNQGDLYVMHGQSQSHYRHSVPATSSPVGPRWSVTFRHHVTQ